MAKKKRNCGNCAWRAKRGRIKGTDVPIEEALFVCARTNELRPIRHLCEFWMWCYGTPLQLDAFASMLDVGVVVTQQHADEAEAWHGEEYRRVQEERYGKR